MHGRRVATAGSATRAWLGLFMPGAGVSACSSGTATETGKALYEQNCRSCHRSISVFADMEPARLQAELAAPALRRHRFRLSLQEQQALLDYLRGGR